ncbi:hypothetical protein FE257_001473 [Aspergillus nanangensis]|uniref:Dienelactone hydrolase domain-containing protein n=1 Tax=Aspergillus nanangensis TaxID=2582783 RepID=A0AAD4CE02_ASPNN|nr:hypothetical protein FE257_001473 [Aspergillus nanangensis]
MACSGCFSGTVNSDTPTGTVATIHGLPTYVARPKGPAQGIVVYIPDLFGWELPNARLLADKYASKSGFTVYLPDFMNGHAASLSTLHAMESLLAPASLVTTLVRKPIWFAQIIRAAVPFFIMNRQSVIQPRIKTFHAALRADSATNFMKIGSAGFCWGGFHTVHLCQDDQPLIDVGFVAHPSGLRIPRDLEAVKVPLSVAVGDVDMMMRVDHVREAKSVLEKNGDNRNEVIIYPGAKHGFAVRANPDVPGQMESAFAAEEQAREWFEKWLGRSSECSRHSTQT